jgi:beta-lactamase class A
MSGHAVSPQADQAMVQIMRGQEMNEMIPAGLPAGAYAAHKTGQITEIHHDAGIIFPPKGEPFVLVILIEGLADDTESAALGSAITSAVYSALRP